MQRLVDLKNICSEITKHIIFPYKIEEGKAVLLSKKELLPIARTYGII